MTATPRDRLRENASGVVATLVTGTWLAAMFTGQDWWLAALLVGYVVVVPITGILFGDEDDDDDRRDGRSRDRRQRDATDDDSTQDALETLRQRYAQGELTDEQFERKLERLLDTDSLESAEDRVRAERERE
ncbi:SHOCT domain-containing protein [Halomicrococcus gelatinilyticus]|uniref:SHOCT domain-containing protein n=1 Tax=Halomicrococcus gelatinilyticus TaxID=1702103 RepID=UPI002E165E25